MHLFKCNVALHVDMTIPAYDIYEIFLKYAEDILKDQVNVAKEIFEVPNQSSEDNSTNIPDSSPTSKGKPRCTSQYFKLLQFHYYIIYLALRLGVEMKP
jgi:hypothetical protein